MKALTLWQPWASAISHGTKRIENRTWQPRGLRLGEQFAIHAAAREPADLDVQSVADVLELVGRMVPDPMPRSAIVAVARFDGVTFPHLIEMGDPQWDWAVGPVCWRLADVIALPETVACKGGRSLWQMPDEVERAVRLQVEVTP